MKLKTIITMLFALTALTGLAQENNYTISGDLSILYKGTSLVVEYDSVYILNDSTGILREGQKQQKYAVKDGKFEISGYVGQPMYSTYLIAAYNKYKDNGLQVLGIAAWDKPEDTLNAIEEEQLPYPQIINSQKIATDAYGITGIPEIILFGPDGTIIARSLRGNQIEMKLAEVFGKKK